MTVPLNIIWKAGGRSITQPESGRDLWATHMFYAQQAVSNWSETQWRKLRWKQTWTVVQAMMVFEFPGRACTFTRKEGWQWIINISETRRETEARERGRWGSRRKRRTGRKGTVSLGEGKTVQTLEHQLLWKRLNQTEPFPLDQENRETLGILEGTVMPDRLRCEPEVTAHQRANGR